MNAVVHKSDETWLQASPLSHFITSSLNNHSFHSSRSPLCLNRPPRPPPSPPSGGGGSSACRTFPSSSLSLFLAMLSCTLLPSSLSPSVPLLPAAFIHPCHFVSGFLLCSFASSLLHSSSSHPSFLFLLPVIMHFSESTIFLFSLFVSHSSHCQTSIIPSIFLCLALISFHTSLTASLHLSFPSFTLSDGSIDSLFDDIAQGQTRGIKPQT